MRSCVPLEFASRDGGGYCIRLPLRAALPAERLIARPGMLLARTASSQAGAVFRYIGKAAQYFECVSESGCNCCGRRPVLPDVRLAVIVVGGVLYSVTAVVCRGLAPHGLT